MSQANNFGSFVDILMSPVPYLPGGSLFARGRAQCRRQAILRKRASIGEVQSRKISERTIHGIIAKGKKSAFSIDGEDIVISKDCWIFGQVSIGSSATVKVYVQDGVNFARKVIMG